VALLYGEDWLWRTYGNLFYSLQTGRPAFPQTHGLPFYDFLNQNPEAAAVFQAAMTGFSEHEAKATIAAYDFAGVKIIVDVGAGCGALLAVILRAFSQVSGVAFDLAPAEPDFKRLFTDSGVLGRATFVAGDFFDELPDGADVYLLKSVLHNWDNAAATRILQVCRRAIALAGRLLVVERLVTTEQGPSEAKHFDINMLVTVGGRERTEREYAALLEQADFRLVRTVPTSSPLTIVEAIPR
jgi:SAM-dependent methyltransferase